MTKRISVFLALLFCSAFISFSQNTNLSQRIPDDALMVFNFNLGNINSKIDLERIKGLEMMKFAFENMKRSMGKDSVIAKKFYNDPNYYGINLLPSMTICVRQTTNEFGENSSNTLFMFNLSNMKKFEKFMKIIYDNGTEYKDFLEVRGSYKVFQSSSAAFIWNTSNAYILPIGYDNRETFETEIESIIALDKSNSLANISSFSDKAMASNDVNFWMNYEKVLENYEEITKEEKKRLFEVDFTRIKGTETSFALDFEEGKIVFQSLSKVNELLKKENNAIFSKSVNKEFFDYIQSDSLIGFYSMAFNIEEMKNSIEKNYKNLLDSLEHAIETKALENIVDTNKTISSIKKQLESDTLEWSARWDLKDSLDHISDSLVALAMKDINKTVDSTFNEFGMTRADAWNLFKGDFLIASTGIYYVLDTIKTFEYSENEDGEPEYQEVEKAKKSPKPLFLTMASINLVDKCEFALAKLEKEGLIKKEADYYFITVTKYDFFIKLNGDVLIFTNDKNIVTKKHEKGVNIFSNEASKELISKAVGSPFYMYIDIEKALEKIPLEGEMEEKMLKPALDVLGNFESKSELSSSNDVSSNTSLNFKKEGNAIHILFDLADEYYKIFTSMH